MKRLTDKGYWERRVGPAPEVVSADTRRTLRAKVISRYFGKLDRGYPRYLIYDVECRKYFPDGGGKVIEIGSAPGQELIAVHQKFGCLPYGVEYTDSGVEANRRVFLEHGLDPENVIQADFFDPDFQDAFGERFDVVMSHGFIEHFTDLDEVIARHVNLLKPGGLLLLTLPNFRWFNYLVVWFFARPSLKAHNLTIMKKKELLSCCRRQDLEVLRCKYIGTLNFSMIYGHNKSKLKLLLMDLLMKLQRVIDMTLYTIFRKGCIETAFFSPKLMIICRKRTTAEAEAGDRRDHPAAG